MASRAEGLWYRTSPAGRGRENVTVEEESSAERCVSGRDAALKMMGRTSSAAWDDPVFWSLQNHVAQRLWPNAAETTAETSCQ
ncbi:hypothetical protein Q5P01_014285 [Channa striata]|uniref:Uncharacterized protein n=1 Tax=Channa striata TaxID=64152 RepID=A0AA88MIK4_CHASR|nr:hypothetical protein Q5P01_014285 [Channa striata]